MGLTLLWNRPSLSKATLSPLGTIPLFAPLKAMPASLRFLVFCALLSLGAGLRAQDETTPRSGPLGQLAESEQLATGIHELSDQQRTNLDNLIRYEIAAARAGNVNGFAGTFSGRRSEAELDATGIARMSDEQRERLDEHIAGFIADTPNIPYLTRAERGRYRGSSSADLREEDTIGRGPLLDVHGSVSVTVGGSSEGTFYGGSMTTIISDPKGRFNAIISIGTMRGAMPYYDRYERSGPLQRPILLP